MSIRRRLEALESQLIGDHVTLLLNDGTTARIKAKRLTAMMQEVMRDIVREDTALVLRSVSDDEPGHLCNLIQVLHDARQKARHAAEEAADYERRAAAERRASETIQ